MDTLMADILHDFDAIPIDREDGSIRLVGNDLDALVTQYEQDAEEGHWGYGIHMDGFPIVVSNNPLYVYSVLACRGFARKPLGSHWEQLTLF